MFFFMHVCEREIYVELCSIFSRISLVLLPLFAFIYFIYYFRLCVWFLFYEFVNDFQLHI